jgi:predicted Zn-dependent protease
VTWCRKATELRPQEPRYAFTLAFYLNQQGDSGKAVALLNELIEKHPAYADAYQLLGGIYEKQGKYSEAEEVYRQWSLTVEGTPGRTR